MMGQWGSKMSNELPEDADLIIWIGSEIEEYDTLSWTRGDPAHAKFIYANIDPNRASNQWIPDVALIGDARLTLAKLIVVCKQKLETLGKREFTKMPRIAKLLELKKSYLESMMPNEIANAVPIHPAKMIKEIADALPRDSVVCSDAGMFAAWVIGYPGIRIFEPGHFLYNAGATAIGQSVALGIGAQLSTDKQVVSIVGDGGFQQYMMEMATAVQYNAPLVVFVSNNQSIAWIAQWQKEIHKERYVATFFEPQVDFAKIAEAQKCKGIRIERPTELKSGVNEAFITAKHGQPVVVDIVTDWRAKHHGPDDFMRVFTEGKYPLPGVR
jgi:acetolactate synthase-1/2/3 large subunit